MNRCLKLFILGGLAMAQLGCQEIEQPAVVLTQDQWKEVQSFLLKEEPKPQHKLGAKFDDKIELIGVDVTELQAGKKATFTWYWRALEDINQNWKVFVHFDGSGKTFRQNLDHVPINGMYPTNHWKKGQIIKDVQEVTVRADFPAGKAVTFIGLYKGQQRMRITSDVQKTKEAQPRLIGPTLDVKPPKGGVAPKNQPKPKYNLRIIEADKAGTIVVDGKLDEKVWSTVPSLRLKPFGSAPKLGTIVKVFVTEDNLYLGAEMADANMWGKLTQRDDPTWTEEVIELFLDVDGDGKDYMELQVTPAGTIFDANFKQRLGRGKGSREDQIAAAKAWNAKGLEVKVNTVGTVNDDSDTDTKWTVELKLPLNSIPGFTTPPKKGDTWAVNLYRFDRPEKDKTHAYAWSTKPRGDFHQVDKFGEFKFVSELTGKRPQITPKVLNGLGKSLEVRARPPKDSALGKIKPNDVQTKPEE